MNHRPLIFQIFTVTTNLTFPTARHTYIFEATSIVWFAKIESYSSFVVRLLDKVIVTEAAAAVAANGICRRRLMHRQLANRQLANRQVW